MGVVKNLRYTCQAGSRLGANRSKFVSELTPQGSVPAIIAWLANPYIQNIPQEGAAGDALGPRRTNHTPCYVVVFSGTVVAKRSV